MFSSFNENNVSYSVFGWCSLNFHGSCKFNKIQKIPFSDMNEIGRQRRKKRKRKENWKQKRRQSASAETLTPTTATRGHSSSRRWRARPRTRSTFAASAKSSSFYLGQRTVVLLWYLSSSSPRWRAGTWGTWTWTRWPTRFRLSQNLQDLLVLLKKIRMWLRGYIPYNKVMTKKLHFKIYYYS